MSFIEIAEPVVIKGKTITLNNDEKAFRGVFVNINVIYAIERQEVAVDDVSCVYYTLHRKDMKPYLVHPDSFEKIRYALYGKSTSEVLYETFEFHPELGRIRNEIMKDCNEK